MKLPWKDKRFIFLIVAIVVVVALEVLSLVDVKIPMPVAPAVYFTIILLIGYNVLYNGLKALIQLNFSSINLLMLIAVIGAFFLQEYSEAAVVVVLYTLGERLEEIGLDSSKSALDNLVSQSPKEATVSATGKSVAIEQIEVGTDIDVKPHNMIPLDGIIESGSSTVDEASITGEPIPKDKNKGDIVFAGTLNKGGFLKVRTTKTSNDTTFSKIIELTYRAASSKSETQKFIQRFALYYTPIIVALSVLVFVVPVFILDKDVDQWLNQAITLLVIACPCALVISTPVALYAALGNASSRGALVKGGKYIEAIGKVKAIGLDKTRTITFGNPIVSDVIP